MEKWTGLIGLTLTILSILAILSGFSVWFYKYVWKPSVQFVDTMYKNKAFVDKVMYNLSPNGGNSLVDKVNRIDSKLDEILNVAKIIERKQKTDRHLSLQPLYECDENGYAIFLNEALLDIMGMSLEEAIGFGWTKAVKPIDQERILAEWKMAVSYGAEFNSVYTFINQQTYKQTKVNGRAKIERDEHKNILYIIGTCEEILERQHA
tara:strand:+ start:20298 stop:20918 length:621 start_codon:yes stop_codon:yes gene_type:complete